MTITEPTDLIQIPEIETVTFDLYRDIHKGIRAELFAMTQESGRVDPGDRAGRADIAAQVAGVLDVLVAHAEHEDAHIQPTIEVQLPGYAARIADEHRELEARMVGLRARAERAIDAPGASQRAQTQALYLELAAFTSSYLAHQDLEERLVMPALEAAVGVESVIGIHGALIASMPPDELGASLAFMIPAMNIDDRTELLGGMQAGAPAEVFEGVLGLVRSVLPASDYAPLAARLGR